MNEKHERIFDICLEKELNLLEVDSLMSTLFKTHEFESLVTAQTIFNALFLVYAFELGMEEIENIIVETGSYEVYQLVKKLVPLEIYEFYHNIFIEEYKINNSVLINSLNSMMEETEGLIQDFKQENTRINELINT